MPSGSIVAPAPDTAGVKINGQSPEPADSNRNIDVEQAPLNPPVAQRKLGPELLRTGIALVCLLFTQFLNFCCLAVIHDIVPWKPLDDLVFVIIPQLSWAWPVADICSVLSLIYGFVVLYLHHERLLVFRRIFLISAILFLLRAIVLTMTYIPPPFANPSEICLPQVKIIFPEYFKILWHRFLDQMYTFGVTSGHTRILCGDSMFSGHSLFLTVMYFTQLRYTPARYAFLRYISMLISFVGMAALVISRGHYTIDVLIAYWLTSHVFLSYHQQFEKIPRSGSEEPLSSLWWFWPCQWFEKYSPEGLLDNVWNVPWPCSKLRITRVSGTNNDNA